MKESVLALLGVGFSVCQKLYWRLPEVKIADPDDTNKASENTNIASMDRNTASGDAHSLTDFLKKNQLLSQLKTGVPPLFWYKWKVLSQFEVKQTNFFNHKITRVPFCRHHLNILN